MADGPTIQAANLGTSFTYQGRLGDGGAPAEGVYDFRFAIFDGDATANPVAGPITNAAVGVSNGLFTVPLDFGAAAFSGEARWLEIAVRTKGTTADFTVLAPRQPLTPVPYALYAPAAGSALAVTGPVASTQLQGPIAADLISPGTVTGAMLATGAVQSEQLAPGAVGASQLAPDAVTSEKIADGTITGADLAASVGVWTRSGANLYSEGNVGIGTNSPRSALHVAGEITAGRYQGPGAMPWGIVTGTIQQAASNTGYLASNAARVTLTLPPNPAAGDVVRVSCASIGGGGWKIGQNAGQSVLTRAIGGTGVALWAAQESARSWASVASSADGIKLVAAVAGGQIYTSVPTTTSGTAGYLTGDPDAAIELQFIGSGYWRVLSHEGVMNAY